MEGDVLVDTALVKPSPREALKALNIQKVLVYMAVSLCVCSQNISVIYYYLISNNPFNEV